MCAALQKLNWRCPANRRAAHMETASPLLQLPEEIWTCVVFRLLTDIRDRVSACLACRR